MGVERRVWRQRGVVGEGGIVVGCDVPRDGGSESWRFDGGREHGGLLVWLGDDRGAESGLLAGGHCEGGCMRE